MNDHLAKDAPQTIVQPDYPRITMEKETKPYIFEHVDTIKLSRSWYIMTSITNYGPYVDNMFGLENFIHTFCRQILNLLIPNLL